LGGEVGNMKED